MGCEIKDFSSYPRVRLSLTRQALEKELEKQKERLLPFYEDDEERLDQDIARKIDGQPGIVGLLSAIAWCHGEIGLYQYLAETST
ncbi:MAG: hypothetical protein ACOC4E_01805 [Patescibacteria group bacterium]